MADDPDQKVLIVKMFASPFDPMMKYLPCETTKKAMVEALGIENYHHAIEQGLITEEVPNA
jgi:hypothetical protein